MSTYTRQRPILGTEDYVPSIVESTFDDRLNLTILEAIDEALSFLGSSAKKAVYYHLEETFKIRREEIPFKIDQFAEAIEEIFGIGAKIIEIEIMKSLYKKLGKGFKYVPKDGSLTLSEYLRAAKNHLQKKKKVKK